LITSLDQLGGSGTELASALLRRLSVLQPSCSFVGYDLFSLIVEFYLDGSRLLVEAGLRGCLLLVQHPFLMEYSRLYILLRGGQARLFLSQVLLKLSDLRFIALLYACALMRRQRFRGFARRIGPSSCCRQA